MNLLNGAGRWISAAKNQQGEALRVYCLETPDAERRRKLVLADVTAAIGSLDVARGMLVEAQKVLLPLPGDEGL